MIGSDAPSVLRRRRPAQHRRAGRPRGRPAPRRERGQQPRGPDRRRASQGDVHRRQPRNDVGVRAVDRGRRPRVGARVPERSRRRRRAAGRDPRRRGGDRRGELPGPGPEPDVQRDRARPTVDTRPTAGPSTSAAASSATTSSPRSRRSPSSTAPPTPRRGRSGRHRRHAVARTGESITAPAGGSVTRRLPDGPGAGRVRATPVSGGAGATVAVAAGYVPSTDNNDAVADLTNGPRCPPCRPATTAPSP